MIIRVLLLATILHLCCCQEISLETISKQFHLRKNNPINNTILSDIWELNFEEFAELLKRNHYNLTGLTPTCQEDLLFTYEAITEMFALGKNNKGLAMKFTLPLLDSWAKRPPPGVLRGNLRVPGFFLECREIHYFANSLNRFVDGEYYRVFHNINPTKPDASGVCALTASYDICLPRSCAEQDLTTMFKQKKQSTCEVRSTNQMVQKVDAGTYIVGIIMGSITIFALITSVIDYYLPEDVIPTINKNVYSIITAFSFHRNVSDMFKVKHINKQTGCLNCFRFFSISWVMAGHMFMIQGAFENNVRDQFNWMSNFQASFYINAFFSVDSFFFMSGFLVAFSWFKIVKNNPGFVTNPLGWVMFYVHRILRLSPPYYFMIFAQGWIIPTLWRDMPNLIEPLVYGMKGNVCKLYWWTSMLYINNWVESDYQCVAVSWYLSADMQMYLASPVILIAFALLGLMGGLLISAAAIALSIGMNYYWVYHFHLPPAAFAANWLTQKNTQDNYAYYIYTNPLTRYQPYVIGMVVGYVVLHFRKIRVPRILNLFLWFLSLGGMFGLIFVAYTWNHSGNQDISIFASATNNALSRGAWALCMSWIVIACYYDQAGIIGDFLNWEIWYPLGRLSYSAYLCHWPIILMVIGYNTQLSQFRNGLETFILRVMPIILLANLFSIYWSAVFERPWAKIEAIIFARPSAKVKPAKPIDVEKVEVQLKSSLKKKLSDADNWEIEKEEEESDIKL